jgi:hypothetical protein
MPESKYSRFGCSGFRLYVTIFDESGWDDVAGKSASRSTTIPRVTLGTVQCCWLLSCSLWQDCAAECRDSVLILLKYTLMLFVLFEFILYFYSCHFISSWNQIGVIRSTLIALVVVFFHSQLITNAENVRPICILPSFPKIHSISWFYSYTMWQLMRRVKTTDIWMFWKCRIIQLFQTDTNKQENCLQEEINSRLNSRTARRRWS